MKTLARILIRPNSEVGLFVPMREHGLEPGLYNLVSIDGDTPTLKYIGRPNIDPQHLGAFSPNGILSMRTNTLMTPAEALQWASQSS